MESVNILSYIRNRCSGLNNDLFENHISVSSKCSCGYVKEDAFHYLFVCPLFIDERTEMLRSLEVNSLPNDIDSLLNGNSMLTQENNTVVFKLVHKFIKKTKRFDDQR